MIEEYVVLELDGSLACLAKSAEQEAGFAAAAQAHSKVALLQGVCLSVVGGGSAKGRVV